MRVEYKSLIGEVDGGPADGAILFILYPLEEALIVKEVSTGAESAAVEQFRHADDTVLIWSGLGGLEDAVETIYQFSIAIVLADASAK